MMIGRIRLSALSLAAAAAMVAGACTSRDDKAAAAAANASSAFDAGQIAIARREIGTAIGLRDDIADYWLLSAHIAMAAGDFAGAFDAYENLLTLDRTNVEALTRLCQIALSADSPQRAERYAGQLLALHPGDTAALTLQASLALQQGDKDRAARLVDQVLAGTAGDPLALVVKSKLLASRDDYAGAARAAEASLAGPGDLTGRLALLKTYYGKTNDAAGYAGTLARLAKAMPDDADAQIDYAANLYDGGDAARAFAVTARLLHARADDVATAGTVLNLWLAQRGRAMPIAGIAPAVANGSLLTRAAFAQYANELGRPDIALTVAGGDAVNAPVTALNADLKVARGYARALRGAGAAGEAEIDAVLATDADQPRALLARGRLRARAGDRAGAIEDLRHALAGDAANASARLAIADLQFAQGDAVLAQTTLREGLADPGADPRIALRLMAMLRGARRPDDAADVLESYRRANPFGPPLRG